MDKLEYIRGLVIGAVGGLIASVVIEVRGMNIFSVSYWSTVFVIFIIIFVVSFIGWKFISSVEKSRKKDTKSLNSTKVKIKEPH